MKFLVPTLCVGTHVWTLCVPSGCHRGGRDAERPDVRSHAERGNERSSRFGLGSIPLAGITWRRRDTFTPKPRVSSHAPSDVAGRPPDPPSPARADKPQPLTPIQQELIRYLDALRPELVAVNQDIWTFAELGLQEHRSAARLVGVLKKAGFKVTRGRQRHADGVRRRVRFRQADHRHPRRVRRSAGTVAGGRRRTRKAVPGRTPVTAAATVPWAPPPSAPPWPSRTSIDKHKLKGTIRVYGTPAEETVIGKVYMTLDGQFEGPRRLPALAPRHEKPRLVHVFQGADLGQVHVSPACRPTPPAVPRRAAAPSTASS